MYVLTEGKELLIIDPVDTEEVWSFLSESDASFYSILLTHEHFDHICGLNKLRERGRCTVYAHSSCSKNICSARKNLSDFADIIAEFSGIDISEGKSITQFECAPADIVFEKKPIFQWQGHRIEMISTPGHSQGSMCILLDDSLLFSGDTLLRIPAITRFPGGNTKQYQEIAVPVLKGLSERAKYIFPGHGEGGTPDEMIWQIEENHSYD